MNNRNIFYIIYFSLLVLITVTIFTLSILGNKIRIGYLSEFKFDENNINKTLTINNIFNTEEMEKLFIANDKLDGEFKKFISTNDSIKKYSYRFKLKYYDRIFKNSDIYAVYIDTNDIIKNNNFITDIEITGDGSPFGNLTSNKIIDNDILNVKYKLKIKRTIIDISVLILLIPLILITLNYFIKNIRVTYNSSREYKKNIYYTIIIFLFLLFSIFIRIFWAYQQEGLYYDEYHSLTFVNNGKWDNSDNIKNYTNKKGYDILKDLTIDDKSIKDCFYDIKRLYEKTNDPFISNLYYTLLRLAFIGREVVNIKNIIMTGTILNCIFFIISFIFLYKILKLIFEDKYDYILFSLFIMSLSPISISFSMFLRAYQMQETFFIVITYLVINTIYNNKYSIKNLIITTIITGIGYLTLYSSMLFVLILSAMLFINYIEHLKNINKINILTPLIKIENYKIIIYYAVSFISALLVSRLLYNSFFSSLFDANNRASNSLKFSGQLFNYINDLSFNGLLIFLFIFIIIYLFYTIKKYKMVYISIKEANFKLLIFIIILGILYALLGDLTSPYKLERYSAPSYILIIFIFPLVFSIINDNRIKYIMFIFLSIIYIYNVTNSKRFSYFEKIDKDRYVLTENVHVYTYKTFFNHYGYTYEYLNTNLYYTYIGNENDLNIVTNDKKFYFLINDNDEARYILTNNILKDYVYHNLNKIGNICILKLEKK